MVASSVRRGVPPAPRRARAPLACRPPRGSRSVPAVVRSTPPLPRRVSNLALTLLVLYVAVCAAAFLFQRRLLYLPGPAPGTTPASVGLEHEELRLVTADGTRLGAWWIPRPDAWAGALVTHGNAGSIEHRLHIARAWHELGVACLLLDYRGYGASEGSPHEQGLYLDAEAGYDELARRLSAQGLGPERVVLHGESLGGAVAVELALRRPVGAVVVESAWSSLSELAARLYPFLPVRFLLRERFDTQAKVARLSAPLLVLHGRRDEIVPFEHGERLAAAAGAELVELAGTHNAGGFALDPRARARVEVFLRDALLGEGAR